MKQLSAWEEKLNYWVAKFFSRVPFVQKMLFVYHLKTMVKAGLSIVAALKILSEEIENKKLRAVIGEIKMEVEKGRQLSEVLGEYPKIFPPIYVSMIAAGETAGKMEEALEQVANQMRKNHELTSHIRGAMIYPAVVLTAILGIAIEMVVFVLPKIMVMFQDFKTDLPLSTRVLIGLVNFIQNYGLLMLLALVGLIALTFYLIRQLPVKRALHSFNLKLPIFGGIIKKINLARFTLTLSSLLQSTIPIVDAIRITADVQTNLIYHETLLLVAEQVRKGESLAEVLGNYRNIFPPMVTEMIMVGEESGKADEMLNELADYYAKEVDSTMKNFSTIIEPVVIIILGLMVAGIAVAVIMPMYSLAQNF